MASLFRSSIGMSRLSSWLSKSPRRKSGGWKTKTSIGLISMSGLSVYLYDGKDSLDKGLMGTVRSFRTIRTCLSMVTDYQLNLLSKTEWASPEEHAAAKSECHSRSAKRLLKLCKQNGGVFIKLGQHLSALVYLLPIEYCDTLKELQDQCPPSSIESLNELFLSDAGQSLDALFSSFDPVPVGVASLAQVHRAVLRETGQEVAVKIQHPALDDFTAVDVKTVSATVKWVKRMFSDFEFDWLAAEMENSLPKEMDFTHEAENANKVRKLFSSKKVLKIPRIYRAQRRILIMEFMHGERLDDINYLHTHNISPETVSSELAKIFSEMIFFHGFVHCDPHGGNILIRPRFSIWSRIPVLSYVLGSHNFELVLLDHGLYRTLNDTFRLEYAHLWDAIIRSDEPEIEEYSYRLFTHNERVTKDGVDHHRLFASMLTGRSWEVISSGGVATQRTDEEMGMISSKVSQGRFMVAIADILAKLPTELLMVLKTNDLLRAVDESLGVGKTSQEHMVRMVSTMGWYCAWAIWDHSAQSYSTFRWFRPAYYADFLHFMKAGVRLWGLKAVIVFQGWKYWFFSSSSIQSGHSV